MFVEFFSLLLTNITSHEVVLRTMERMEKKEEDRAKVGECNVE